jgi:hypothetical protein
MTAPLMSTQDANAVLAMMVLTRRDALVAIKAIQDALYPVIAESKKSDDKETRAFYQKMYRVISGIEEIVKLSEDKEPKPKPISMFGEDEVPVVYNSPLDEALKGLGNGKTIALPKSGS